MKIFIVTVLALQAVYCDWTLEPKEVNYFYKRTECSRFNPKFIAKFNCSHKFGGRNLLYSSLEFTIHPGVALDNIIIDITTYKKFGTVYRPTLVKFRENFCDMIGNKSNSYFAREFRKLLDTYITNLNEPCPLQGHKYKRDNLTLYNDPNKPSGSLPPLIPIGDWKFVFKYTTYMNGPEEFILQTADVYEVTQKSATQF